MGASHPSYVHHRILRLNVAAQSCQPLGKTTDDWIKSTMHLLALHQLIINVDPTWPIDLGILCIPTYLRFCLLPVLAARLISRFRDWPTSTPT